MFPVSIYSPVVAMHFSRIRRKNGRIVRARFVRARDRKDLQNSRWSARAFGATITDSRGRNCEGSGGRGGRDGWEKRRWMSKLGRARAGRREKLGRASNGPRRAFARFRSIRSVAISWSYLRGSNAQLVRGTAVRLNADIIRIIPSPPPPACIYAA